jgi:predicted Zn-dependent protease
VHPSCKGVEEKLELNPSRKAEMRITARRQQALTLVLLAAALQASGCARNPVTGQMQLALISEQQEIEMGRQTAAQVAAQIGIVQDEALQQYVHGIGTQLAANSERPSLPWSFGVVDDPTPNAFALPGGFIFLTRGLMSLMESEAQMASVLGHEIGHVTARHSVTMISRAQAAQLGLGIGSIFLPQLQALEPLAGAGLQLLFLRYSRDAERQADDLGYRYTLEQNYDVREMTEVFAALQRVGEVEGRSGLPSWLATHPNPAERIAAMQQRLAELEPATRRVGSLDYLNRIDGMVYGVNPRNGFFRDGLYLHPDLRFRMSFPAGWQTQNLAQAVVAVSQRQDAMIQLTLAQDATPNAAAQRFAAQQGVQPGPRSATNVNGLPAAVLEFQAQTQQGILRGVALFIQYEGRVYQIIGFTPQGVYAQYERIIQQSLASFAQLTDPAVLNVQPNRLRITPVTERMTVAQFHARYPSVIPVAEVALINQLDGPESVIEAGSRVKRVVTGSP